jgi:hypothetical protein
MNKHTAVLLLLPSLLLQMVERHLARNKLPVGGLCVPLLPGFTSGNQLLQVFPVNARVRLRVSLKFQKKRHNSQHVNGDIIPSLPEFSARQMSFHQTEIRVSMEAYTSF